jgi:hypothetical protein
MTSISLRDVANFFNQPAIKEGIKNAAGGVNCLFGFVEIYTIYQEPLAEDPNNPFKTAAKMARVAGILSIFLTAGTSRPAVFVISQLIPFSTQQLEKVFGPNTIYAVNPNHPRHVCSIVAFWLGNMHLAYKGVECIYKKVNHLSQPKDNNSETGMVLINLFISRVFLHVAAQFFSK